MGTLAVQLDELLISAIDYVKSIAEACFHLVLLC